MNLIDTCAFAAWLTTTLISAVVCGYGLVLFNDMKRRNGRLKKIAADTLAQRRDKDEWNPRTECET